MNGSIFVYSSSSGFFLFPYCLEIYAVVVVSYTKKKIFSLRMHSLTIRYFINKDPEQNDCDV